MFKVPEESRVSFHPLFGHMNSSLGDNGVFKFPEKGLYTQASNGDGWEHVSVSLLFDDSRCPTWEEMCFIKSKFWGDDDVVVQYHPAKKDYVNCHNYTLHLWRKVDKEFETPPSIMVGPKSYLKV